MKGGLLGPEALAAVEHALAHDAHAGTVESLLQDAIVLAGLTTIAKLEVLAEELLLEHPLLKLAPLAGPILVVWVVGVIQIHSFRGDEAVERHSDAEEHLAHAVPPYCIAHSCVRSSSLSFSNTSRHPS